MNTIKTGLSIVLLSVLLVSCGGGTGSTDPAPTDPNTGNTQPIPDPKPGEPDTQPDPGNQPNPPGNQPDPGNQPNPPGNQPDPGSQPQPGAAGQWDAMIWGEGTWG